jgi:methylated-DNA-protein-cysteine methyltransferase-like protein
MTDRDDFTEAVIAVLERLQPGDLVTYGEVATEAGYPGAARAVGNLLRTVPGLPWWRVVNAAGRMAPGHEKKQAELLRAEGAMVKSGKAIRGT